MGPSRLEEAERRTREIVASAGLPEPDEVEYGEKSIFLVWHEQKLVVQVTDIPLTPPDQGEESSPTDAAGACRDG